MRIMNGAALAKKIRSVLAIEIDFCKNKYGRAPKLSVILVGNDPASMTYVKNKGKSCNEVGIESDMHYLPFSTSQEDLLSLIKTLNEDDSVDGILVQVMILHSLINLMMYFQLILK